MEIRKAARQKADPSARPSRPLSDVISTMRFKNRPTQKRMPARNKALGLTLAPLAYEGR